MTEKPWEIYALVDPRNDDIRYIGKTVNPKFRLCNTAINTAILKSSKSCGYKWIKVGKDVPVH